MKIKFKGERKKSIWISILAFVASNIIFALSLSLTSVNLTFWQILYASVCITAFVFSFYNAITFFTYNKFEFKWNKNK